MLCRSLLFVVFFTCFSLFAQQPRSLEKTVDVQASVAQVWTSWTTSEGIAAFFAKENKVELKLGGPFEMYFLPKDQPERGSEGCTVQSYIPREMFSFTWNAPPQFPEVRKQHTMVTLHFTSLAENRTAVRLTQTGWGRGEQWDQVYTYFDKAWDLVLHNFKAHYEDREKVEQYESTNLYSNKATLALAARLAGPGWQIDGKWNDGNPVKAQLHARKSVNDMVLAQTIHKDGDTQQVLFESTFALHPEGGVNYKGYAAWGHLYEGEVYHQGNTLIMHFRVNSVKGVGVYRQDIEFLDDNRYKWEVFKKTDSGYESTINIIVQRMTES